jgi:hypothetical protein
MNNEEQIDAAKVDDRLPYQRPDLLEVGQIADITLSNGNNGGVDSGYS